MSGYGSRSKLYYSRQSPSSWYPKQKNSNYGFRNSQKNYSNYKPNQNDKNEEPHDLPTLGEIPSSRRRINKLSYEPPLPEDDNDFLS